jgi:hypothetical protein
MAEITNSTTKSGETRTTNYAAGSVGSKVITLIHVTMVTILIVIFVVGSDISLTHVPALSLG